MDNKMNTSTQNAESIHLRNYIQKNCIAKVAHEKRRTFLEKEKTSFVRQHSKEENEIKQMLQRLHVEQGIIHDKEQAEKSRKGIHFFLFFNNFRTI